MDKKNMTMMSLPKKRKIKRLSGSLGINLLTSNSSNNSNCSSSYYYPSNYITNPCDQLFGPQTFDSIINLSTSSSSSLSSDLHNTTTSSLLHHHHHHQSSQDIVDRSSCSVFDSPPPPSSLTVSSININHNNNPENDENFDYIPTPKWNKIQNALMEELYKKTRFPKANELKCLAQRFNVMDCDIEVGFLFFRLLNSSFFTLLN
jgi:hypothetical protein